MLEYEVTSRFKMIDINTRLYYFKTKTNFDNEFDIKSKELDYSYSYHGACTQTCINENQGGELGNSLGVVFSSGFGDGCYDVYAYTKDIKGWGNRVCKVEIVLIDSKDRK